MPSEQLDADELAVGDFARREAGVEPGRHLAILHTVAATLSRSLDLNEILRTALDALTHVTGHEISSLHLLTSDRRQLHLRGDRGLSDRLRQANLVLPRGEGLIGGVAVSGKTIVLTEVTESPDLLPAAREAVVADGIRGFVSVPIRAHGTILGAMSLGRQVPDPFSPEDVRLLEATADQIAVALENAQLYLEAQQRRREADELARTARRLTEHLEVSAVSERIVESLLPLFRATSALLWQGGRDGDLVCVATAGRPLAHVKPGSVLPKGVGIVGRAATEGRPAWTPDMLAEWNIVLTEDLRQGLADTGHYAALAVPLSVKGQIIGVLAIADSVIRPFAEAEVGLLQTFADQAALALENARLFEDARAARDFLQSIAENSVDGIVTTDGHGQITYVSPGAEEIFGYARNEVLGRPIANLYRFGVAEARVIMHRLHAEGRIRNYETAIRAKDGRWVDVSASISLLRDAGGAIVGTLGIMQDISERKKLEQNLRQAQKMEAVGRLAGGIAHDFNNLLTVITGRSALLLQRLSLGDPVRRDIELFQRTGERAAGLTRQLLAFSRRQMLQPRVLDLNAVVMSLSTMLRRLIGEDIDLMTVLGPSLGPIRADPGQLEQVIVNLVLNARDSMPQGGQLTIQTANADIDENHGRQMLGVSSGAYTTLSVTDTGIGMDAETRSHIFEPFFTTKAPGEGTGLGLATVYGIIEQSGGEISVMSEPGRGTTFTIYLPRVDQLTEAPETVRVGTAAATGGETVLLVEDEDDVRELAREILEGQHYRVLDARDPEAALRIAERHRGPIHLLLTDVVMPQMSGRRLAEQLGALRPEMKVVYMSGYTDDTILRHGVADSAATVLIPKPFAPEGLIAKLRDVLGAGPAS
jgi:PAS domain S-box-containing protein